MKFKVVSADQPLSTQVSGDPMQRIESMVQSAPIFVFMKGTANAPRCGFSAKVAEILSAWGAPFETFDVLSDETIRGSIKSYSNWPTIPQIFINNKFIGGCDIMEELSGTQELLPLLQEAYPGREFTPPKPPAEVKTLTPQAAVAMLKENPQAKLIDVRSPNEWQIGHVESALLINQDLVDEMIDTWDPATPLLFICHRGMRSFDAARFFASQGFENVNNIAGGIDSWSLTVDPAIPRY